MTFIDVPTRPKPDTVEDLPDYRTAPVMLARITVASDAVGSGVLSATEDLVTALRNIYPDVHVSSTQDGIEISRPQNAAELNTELLRAQKAWQDEQDQAHTANQRAQLAVGDSLSVTPVVRCQGCSLEWNHKGDHIIVESGFITAFTPRN